MKNVFTAIFLSFPVLIGLTVLLTIVSCSVNNNDHATVGATTTDTAVHQMSQKPYVRNQITDAMLTQIINYYRNEYGGDSIHMTITSSDTLLELNFEDTVGGPDHFQGVLLAAYIPLVTEINPIVSGDINGDGINDMLISVPTEGGGGGGNVYWRDHFLFVAGPSGENTLTDIKSDGEIMDGSGYFFPKEISNQIITGIGNRYDKSDGRCCPSLYYRMRVRLDNGQLTTIDQTAIAKPAEFKW